MSPLEETSVNTVQLQPREEMELEFGRSENTWVEFPAAEVTEHQVDLEQLKNLPDTIFNFSKRRRQALVQIIFNNRIKLRQNGLI